MNNEFDHAGSIDLNFQGQTDRSILIIMQNKKRGVYTDRPGQFHSIGEVRFKFQRGL